MWRRWAIIVAAVLALAACSDSATRAPSGLYDCSENTPGTGDLATDLIGKWQFFENSSPQHLTFGMSGNVIRTWNTPETGEVLYTAHPYEVGDEVVMITDLGDFTFETDETGEWRVLAGSEDLGWTRCSRAGGSAR